ncbi:MAG: substrate-binding domain-containing protein [Gammaproteobacteria bacterium]|nr:substrate-binding domain-containing protein [Gammaproteobacteria bacterium]
MNFIKIFLSISLLVISTADAATLRLATTTSTVNSGLLDYLLPSYESKTGNKVHVIAVGTGKALRMGRDGDVDVVLVHARNAELEFIQQGHGKNRRDVMYNDFVIVGPKDDPAGIKGMKRAGRALSRVAAIQARFISRGDNSGTHKKELSLWGNTQHSGRWYLEAGQGMGKVLQITNEMGGYTLVDRGTWLAYQDKINLMVLVEGDKNLFNPYGVIAVNPDKHKDIKYRESLSFINWLTSASAQAMIGNYRIHNQQLFIPDAK